MNRITTLTAIALATSVAASQPYFLESSTIDGGGGTISGATYELSGTIGQPDAAVLSGPTYTLTGGFWVAGNPGPAGCNAGDLAVPFGVLDLADINAFTSGFLGRDPIADLNTDGLFDLTDINLFVSAFVAGCP